MEEFCSSTSIHGVEFFSSKDKFIRRCGILVFFIAFCGLGFYMHEIYLKWRIEPIIGEEMNLIPLREIPFPAVTICNPIFTRDQKPNLYEVLKSDRQKLKLSIEEQNHLAANVQACTPQLSGRILKFCPQRNQTSIVESLRKKFENLNEVFVFCSFRYKKIDCDRFLNYVLTDFGFCFSYNLLGFNHLFNTNVIADDFKSYQEAKILHDFGGWNFTFDTEETKSMWTLEKGYFNKDINVFPIRSAKSNVFSVTPKLNNSDMKSNNFNADLGVIFEVFLHMPNEIVSPFHKPFNVPINVKDLINLTPIAFKTDKSLRVYSPSARDCYFEGEKTLKFFKFYTKSNCEFECLAEETLKVCKCVKFSMPRNNSTPICDLDKVKCYERVKKNWSRISPTCECFHSCSRIEFTFSLSRGVFMNPSINTLNQK